MSKTSDARVKLDRPGEALGKDLDMLSDDELYEEIAADDDVEKTVSHMRNLVELAIYESERRRLAKARKAYDAIGEKGRPIRET